MILRGSRCTFLSYVYFQYGTLTQFEVALFSGPFETIGLMNQMLYNDSQGL